MKTVLIKNAAMLVTMNETRQEIPHGSIYIENGIILQLGKTEALPQHADIIIDAKNHLVMPGMVNTHHHMYQSLTRAVPAAQDCELFSWLKTLYPIWGKLTPKMIKVSTYTAMAELLLSGCTTTSDHLYIYPNNCRLDDSIEAANNIGMRFHAMRGAMSVGESKGGLPPDYLVEDEKNILADMQRVIETYHDGERYSMLRVGLAPCSPFSVSRQLMKNSAELARVYNVSLHTHLAENQHDIDYTREKFSCTPAQYAGDLGWVGEDVWHAHCVQLDDSGINLFANTCTGVAHCPSSNMRLASGIAPIRKMLDSEVNVGLGVDGCASNDGAHMLAEARQAMLLARVGSCNPGALSARKSLEMATLGGAKVLNRDDIGYLAPGMAADIVGFDLRSINYAGALSDPLAALLFCAPNNVDFSFIQGKVVVLDGAITTFDLPQILEKHQEFSNTISS